LTERVAAIRDECWLYQLLSNGSILEEAVRIIAIAKNKGTASSTGRFNTAGY
jgi:hypothetical protein